jgi:hypothetical protein
VTTIREAALREWTLLTPQVIEELENFLFNYTVISDPLEDASRIIVSNRSNKYVQRQILQTLAVLYKRRTLDNNNNIKSTNMVKDTIDIFKKNPNIKLKQICCSLLLAIITEFSNTNSSTKMGLSSDSHLIAKRTFENNEFKLILVFIFESTQNLMETLIKMESSGDFIYKLDRDSKDLLLLLFRLIEQSFNWEFTSNKHILKNVLCSINQSVVKTSDSNSNEVSQVSQVPLEPTPEFKEFFLNPNLISLLFKSYKIMRDDSDLAHICMQTITQLSTLNGPIFRDDESQRILFLTHFFQCFLQTFMSFEMKHYESFNFACLVENLLTFSNIKYFHFLDPQLVNSFFDLIFTFVVKCFKAEKQCSNNKIGNINDNNDDGDDDNNVYLESYEKILIAWTSIKNLINNEDDEQQQQQFKPDIILKKYSQNIFDSFVQSRLSSLNRIDNSETIQLNDIDEDNGDGDSDDSTEDDLNRYKEVLYAISDFSKYSLDHCLPILSKYFINFKF